MKTKGIFGLEKVKTYKWVQIFFGYFSKILAMVIREDPNCLFHMCQTTTYKTKTNFSIMKNCRVAHDIFKKNYRLSLPRHLALDKFVVWHTTDLLVQSKILNYTQQLFLEGFQTLSSSYDFSNGKMSLSIEFHNPNSKFLVLCLQSHYREVPR